VFGATGTGPSTKEFPAAKTGAAGKAGASTAGGGGSGGRNGQAGGGLAGAWRRTSPPQRKLVAGAAALMVAAAVAIAVVSLGPGGKSGSGSQSSAAAGTQTSGGGAPTGQPSPSPAPSGSHKPRHHKPAKHHQPAKKPKASPSPSPTPKSPRRHRHPGHHGVARLTAAVSVSGPTRSSRDARVVFSASNIGSLATKHLSSSITLPAGAVLAHDWGQNGSSGGWDCHSGGHLVICRHGSVPKSNEAVGSFSIMVRSRTACGQPVTFTVDGGTARTKAQSSALIRCSDVRFGALDVTTQSTLSSGPQLTARLARPLAV